MFTAGKKFVLKYGGKQILKLKDGLPLLEPNKPNDSQEEREQSEEERVRHLPAAVPQQRHQGARRVPQETVDRHRQS